MTEEEMMARGEELMAKCYGGAISVPQPIDPKAMSGLTLKMFNDYWGDERLTFREKRLIIIGALLASGADASLFEIHTSSALRNKELTNDELRSAVLMALPYVGFPKVAAITATLEKVIAANKG